MSDDDDEVELSDAPDDLSEIEVIVDEDYDFDAQPDLLVDRQSGVGTSQHLTDGVPFGYMQMKQMARRR